MGSEKTHGLSTGQVPVSAYVGSSKNLEDLKDHRPRLPGGLVTSIVDETLVPIPTLRGGCGQLEPSGLVTPLLLA